MNRLGHPPSFAASVAGLLGPLSVTGRPVSGNGAYADVASSAAVRAGMAGRIGGRGRRLALGAAAHRPRLREGDAPSSRVRGLADSSDRRNTVT